MSVKRSTFEILCCPVCKGDLELESTKTAPGEDGEEQILEGTLRCTRCRAEYPVADGIPDLLPREEEGC